MASRLAVVTGANSGLGFEVVRAYDAKAPRRLWADSEAATGVRFTALGAPA